MILVKKLWRIIKQLLGTNKKKSKINEINGKTDSADMAEQINQFFINIGPDLARNIPDSLLDMDLSFKGNHALFKFSEISVDDVVKNIKRISSNKSTGVDGVPIRFIKIVIETTSRLICHIINRSLVTVTVPEG